MHFEAIADAKNMTELQFKMREGTPEERSKFTMIATLYHNKTIPKDLTRETLINILRYNRECRFVHRIRNNHHDVSSYVGDNMRSGGIEIINIKKINTELLPDLKFTSFDSMIEWMTKPKKGRGINKSNGEIDSANVKSVLAAVRQIIKQDAPKLIDRNKEVKKSLLGVQFAVPAINTNIYSFIQDVLNNNNSAILDVVEQPVEEKPKRKAGKDTILVPENIRCDYRGVLRMLHNFDCWK